MKKNTKPNLWYVAKHFIQLQTLLKFGKNVPEASHSLADIVWLGAFFKHGFCLLMSMLWNSLLFPLSFAIHGNYRCSSLHVEGSHWYHVKCWAHPLLRAHPADAPDIFDIECKVCSGIMLLVWLQMIFFWKIFRTIKLYNYLFSSIRTL